MMDNKRPHPLHRPHPRAASEPGQNGLAADATARNTGTTSPWPELRGRSEMVDAFRALAAEMKHSTSRRMHH